jgi:hypothetical protein
VVTNCDLIEIMLGFCIFVLISWSKVGLSSSGMNYGVVHHLLI